MNNREQFEQEVIEEIYELAERLAYKFAGDIELELSHVIDRSDPHVQEEAQLLGTGDWSNAIIEALPQVIAGLEKPEPFGDHRDLVLEPFVSTFRQVLSDLLNRDNKVVISVEGGVADIASAPSWIDVEIIDYDNEEATQQDVDEWIRQVLED